MRHGIPAGPLLQPATTGFTISEDTGRSLANVIAARTGLSVRDDSRAVEKAIRARGAFLKLSTAQEYCDLLRTAGAEAEWRALIPLLTTGESFFFRDAELFRVLSHRLLPDLMRRQKDGRALRIWSAGCSTGEEAYSLAILLAERVPIWEGRSVEIVGTDINEDALEQARQGVYSSWSLRALPGEMRRRYFSPRGGGWELDARIRSMACFGPDNLIEENASAYGLGLYDLDLVVCRNVFIYFSQESISRAVLKLAGSLRTGGCLITGHNELRGQHLRGLKAGCFGEPAILEKLPATADSPDSHDGRLDIASLRTGDGEPPPRQVAGAVQLSDKATRLSGPRMTGRRPRSRAAASRAQHSARPPPGASAAQPRRQPGTARSPEAVATPALGRNTGRPAPSPTAATTNRQSSAAGAR